MLDGYLQRITELPGDWTWYNAPVSARWDGPSRYTLVQLTQHPDGVWLFNEALSSALEEFRKTCSEELGQLDLEPMSDRWSTWSAEIADNTTAITGPVGHWWRYCSYLPHSIGIARSCSRAAHGWIMDIYLLRRRSAA